jgi:hypothetical protein
LTASTSFVTRKDSGVLSPDFASQDEDGKVSPPSSDPPPKRPVLYYAAGSGIPEIKIILSGACTISIHRGRFFDDFYHQALSYMVTLEVALSLSRLLDWRWRWHQVSL